MPAREEVTFPAGDGSCGAWLWRPDGASGVVPCVVMGHGFSLTRHDGFEAYASRLVEAGVAVLAFDYRHFGDSPGVPRQRFRLKLQREVWRGAIAFARRQAGIDGRRIVLFGYSFGAAHVVEVAAADPDGIAALVLVAPFLDGLWRALRTPPRVSAWITPRALADALGRHTTVPVTAQPGERAAMTFPGEADGFARAVASDSPWRNRISPAIFLTVATVRPMRRRVPMPVLVAAGGRDVSVSAKAIERFAARSSSVSVTRYEDYDHFSFFAGDGRDRVSADVVAWLRSAGLVV